MNIFLGRPKCSYSLVVLQQGHGSPSSPAQKRLENVLLSKAEALLESLPPNSILLLIPSKRLGAIASNSSLTKWLEELQQLMAAVQVRATPYLTVDEAAAYCRVAVQTIYNRRKEIDRVPGVRRLLFTKETLDTWLATRRKRR